jgi:hypothetical protein
LTGLAFGIADVVATALANAAIFGTRATVFAPGIAHAITARCGTHYDFRVAQLSFAAQRFAADDVRGKLATIPGSAIWKCSVTGFVVGGIASRSDREPDTREKTGPKRRSKPHATHRTYHEARAGWASRLALAFGVKLGL